MRPVFLIPALIIVPLASVYLLKMLTGDFMSAVVFALFIFVTVAAWYGSLPYPARRGGRY